MTRRSRAPLSRFSWRQIDITTRWLFPFALLVFGLFVLGMPFGIPGQATLRPVYAMACVYFWSLYRPGSMPAILVALGGLLLDGLGYSPFGLWAVLLLLLQVVTLSLRQKLAFAPFLGVWVGFIVLSSGFALLSWLLTCALNEMWLSFMPVYVEISWAICLYPALAFVLIRAHRGLAATEQV